MSKLPYDLAREAMTVLEFFQVPFSSGHEYQKIFQETLLTLRVAARNAQSRGDQTSNTDHKFLMMFADTLEQSNKPGLYANHFGAKTADEIIAERPRQLQN